MKGFFLFLILLAVAVFSCMQIFFQVQETEYAIVKFFGDPRRIIEQPGLAVKWPWPVEEVVRIDKRVNATDVLDVTAPGTPRESEYLTRDKKNILVNAFVAWQVVDPLKFLVSVNDKEGAESRLVDILRSELGAEIGNYALSDLVSTGEAAPENEGMEGLTADSLLHALPPGETRIPEIMDRITGHASEATLKAFGIEILSVRMKRINFPRQNKQAVFERMEAERERIAVQYRSEGKEMAEKLKAEADRRKAELINTAARKAEEIKGFAMAEATRIYGEAYSRDPEFYQFLKSLETYEQILDEEDLLILPEDSPLLELLKEGR